jgi:hypothetical protein
MRFKDKNIHDIIGKLKNQYQLFIHNQFINYYLLNSDIPTNDWLDIEGLINANKYYEAEGYDFNKLYDQILTFTAFLTKIKKEILLKMKDESEYRMKRMSPDNKILFKMTLDNMSANLKTFYDIITELFVDVTKMDIKLHGEENLLYNKLPYLKEIEKRLNIGSQ